MGFHRSNRSLIKAEFSDPGVRSYSDRTQVYGFQKCPDGDCALFRAVTLRTPGGCDVYLDLHVGWTLHGN